MACPGGCSGGGGQPYPPRNVKVLDKKLLAKRGSALYEIDKEKTLRRSHENPAVLALYKEFLGEVGGPKAHEFLHTSYGARLPRGIIGDANMKTSNTDNWPKIQQTCKAALGPEIVEYIKTISKGLTRKAN